jgi:hypothetical protein
MEDEDGIIRTFGEGPPDVPKGYRLPTLREAILAAAGAARAARGNGPDPTEQYWSRADDAVSKVDAPQTASLVRQPPKPGGPG